MRRLAIPAALIAAATILPAPAHADPDPYHPYDSGDLSTVEACTWNYYRVVSIGEGLAHRLGDSEAALEDAQASVDTAQATVANQAATITRQQARIARLVARVERLKGRR